MNEDDLITLQIPANLVKLLRRLAAMPNGRFLLSITKEGGEIVDWSLVGAGKVERPSATKQEEAHAD